MGKDGDPTGLSIARYHRVFSAADWFDAARARAYLTILIVIMAVVVVGYVGLSAGLNDPFGKALGTDFASFWTASRLALSGDSAGPWNIDTHRAAQAAMFGEKAGYAAFFYPPPYLLVCLPLALLPYVASLFVWLATTGAAWIMTVRAWSGGKAGWLLILAFPAVLVNAGHGQNAFLTAALFGGAALISQRRPWLSGLLFGALIIKPHLALLVPLFFVFSGNWRGFLAAGASAAGLSVLSLVVFGPEAWTGFFDASALARATLEHDLVGYAKMQSVYAGVRLMGGADGLAWSAQGIALVLAVTALWMTRRAPEAARGAVLVCATLIATPFLLDYDLVLLGAPLAWLFCQARQEGFRSWDKLILTLAFLSPLIARPLAMATHFPIAPLVILALLVCVVRRCAVLSPATYPFHPSLIAAKS
ncbi:glycosyltransferase family 87 protein [soil metagenome]